MRSILPRQVLLASLCAITGSLAAAKTTPVPPAAVEQFERGVRPVLAEQCFSCHGPAVQEGGLRLDSRAALLKGGSRGAAVVPGHPERSLLVQALNHAGGLKMPPGKRLPPATVEAVTTWIRQSAPWPAGRMKAEGGRLIRPPHWAFQPVVRPPLPKVKETAWVRNPVDAFVLAKLEAKGLHPAPPADPRTLIRRVYYDLTGLPPTPEEVDAFVRESTAEQASAKSPNTQHRTPNADAAYRRLIDRLLASPQYGERWGRYWLDVARYSDTKGYVFFQDGRFPWAYTYRDYVIRAFNEDKPYDQFIREQLAGDQLQLQDKRDLAAMGFVTVGGRFMNNAHDILDDRIDVVSRGFMGLTVSCARCHDHKFDPISTRDYYSFYGVFASSAEPIVPPSLVPDPGTEASAAYEKELQKRYQALMDYVHSKHGELVNGARTRVAEYLIAANTLRTQPRQDDFMLLADGADLNPQMIIRWQAYLERARGGNDPVFRVWSALADLPEKEFAQRAPATVAQVLATRGINPRVAAAFRERPVGSLAEAARRYSEALNAVDQKWKLAQAAVDSRTPPRELPDPADEALRRVFYGPTSPPEIPLGHPSDLGLFPDRPSQAKLQELLKAVETWLTTGAAAPPRAMALEDLPQPYEPRVFRRGNPNNPGETVPRQFLTLLSGKSPRPFTHGSGRLELARAIADPNKTLTARVMVNRVLLNHIGSPHLSTPTDFGLRSDPPTHPELLDWLASEFTQPQTPNTQHRTPWSLKTLHRLLLLSNTYQQASWDRPEARKIDPENRLLWRMNRRRLDFEAMRDTLLSACGGLDLTMGGPPVDLLAGTVPARRTIYGSIDRLAMPGLLRTFDFPSPDATSPQRDATTVPQQALYLMNHRFVREAAHRLAHRPEVTAAPDLPAKVTALYRVIYGRVPDAAELEAARAYLGATPADALWDRYAQVLLESNELLFVD